MLDIVGRIKSYRSWWLVVIPVAVLLWFLKTDPDGGLQLGTQLQALVSPFLALLFSYVARKAIIPGDAKSAWVRATEGSLSSAIQVLAVALLTGMLFLGFSPRAMSSELPNSASKNLPVLTAELNKYWASMPYRSILAAQVEQESLWKERAELKTSREYGFGLGQFTQAYRSDGRLRFDAMAEIRAMHGSLAGWNWANRFNPTYQLRAVALKNKGNFQRFNTVVPNKASASAMMDAAYNCGIGCVQARRRMCAQVEGCIPTRWFGHVERYSAQSKTKWHGYGKSAHEITNEHVRNVMIVRRAKYKGYFREA